MSIILKSTELRWAIHACDARESSEFLFVAGMAGDFAAQAKKVFANIEAALRRVLPTMNGLPNLQMSAALGFE